MADFETLGILEEIEALVSDKLQVVSYKWLSRNYLVSSNAAKRLLQEFMEKNGSGFEVVYTLSGWLKNNPSVYHIKLVPGLKLAEAKQEFDSKCSVQVYSVQASIPKDPAALWNAEFVQAEELFMQPSTVDNCLRDNRFCSISNSFVKRNAEGAPVSNTAPLPKNPGVPGLSKTNSVHQTITVPQPQQRKVQQSSPKVALQSPNIATDPNSGSNGTEVHDQASKPPANKEKAPLVPSNKKKGQTDKSSTGTGGSLANLWGRASAKPKPSSPPAETNDLICNPNVSAEAQICAREVIEGGSSDDDGQGVKFKRASNGEGSRKRRVVFDFSDEEDITEDAVNLASPDLPKGQSCLESKHSLAPHANLNFDKQEDKPKIQEEKKTEKESNLPVRENSSVLKGKNTGVSSSKSIQSSVPEDVDKKGKVTSADPSPPKRRKVMKTWIDERGREVTEVVWEGEETEPKKAETNTTKKAETKAETNTTKKAETNTTKKAETNTTQKAETNTTKKAETNAVTNGVNRAPAAKKSPAVPSNTGGGKAGKKGGNAKDPKQGNIMSFFKKV